MNPEPPVTNALGTGEPYRRDTRAVRRSTTALLAVAALAGCGGGETESVTLDERTEPAPAPPKKHHAKRVPSAHCPKGAANCKTARGRVIYVEAVDPDGDGDAHFVLATTQSLSAPGLTVIDVERNMRPRRLPREGDEVTAAGPVYRGSHGQRQIQATELHLQRGR